MVAEVNSLIALLERDEERWSTSIESAELGLAEAQGSLLELEGKLVQRRQDEVELLAVDRCYRSFFTQMALPFFIIASDGHIIKVNQAFVKFFGYQDQQRFHAAGEFGLQQLLVAADGWQDLVNHLVIAGQVGDYLVAVKIGDKEEKIVIDAVGQRANDSGLLTVFGLIKSAPVMKELGDKEENLVAFLSTQPCACLNARAAIDRLQISEKSYGLILQKFVELNSERYQEFMAIYQAGDFKALQRLAHTLKGAAGNIGADGLSSLVFDLENVCPGGDGKEIEPRLIALKDPLAQVINCINRLC